MKFERKIQDQEIKILDKRLSLLDKQQSRLTRFLVIWILSALIIGAIAFFRMNRQDEILLLGATIIAYIAAGFWGTAGSFLKQKKERKSITYLLTENRVTVIQVNSSKYYELKEQEDEGTFYLFQLDDDNVFSFGGQDFYTNKAFPSDKFEIVEGRGLSNEVLLLKTFIYGNPIEPLKVFSGQKKWDILNQPTYPDPNKLTIRKGKIEDFVQEIQPSNT